MNIATLTESPNRLITDQTLPKLPEEIREVVNTEGYTFYAFGPIERDKVYDFSGNQLYHKDNKGITKLDFTGELFFGDIFFLEGDNDLELIYKAIFVKGLLDSIDIHFLKTQPNSGRKKTMQAIMDRIDHRNRLYKNPVFKWTYLPLKGLIVMFFSLVRAGLFFVFKLIDLILLGIQKFLTPL